MQSISSLLIGILGLFTPVANLLTPSSSTQATSPPFYPSPWMNPSAVGWEDAYTQAKAFVSQLTLLEKVNLTSGVGWEGEQVNITSSHNLSSLYISVCVVHSS